MGIGYVIKQNIKSDLTIIKKSSLLPYGALITAVFLWGGSFSAMRVAVSAINPWAVMWIRMITATLIILPFSKKVIPDNFQKSDIKFLIPMVLFQPCLYFLFESYALKFTTSSQAGVISASVPILVTFFAFFFLSEKSDWKKILGLLLSIGGVILLTLEQDSDTTAINPLLGNSLEITAMIFAAANMIIVKKMSERYNTWTLTTLQLIAGSLFFSPGLYFIANSELSLWNYKLILIFLFLGAFVTLFAFGLYNWGISRISASKASTFINLVPVIAVITGWTLLNESLNTTQLIASGVVITGVIISQRR